MRLARRIVSVLTISLLVSAGPSRACGLTIRLISLWERLAEAKQIVVAEAVCSTRPRFEAQPWALEAAIGEERRMSVRAGEPLPELSRAEVLVRRPELFEPVSTAERLVVQSTWKGPRIPEIRPVNPAAIPCEDEPSRSVRRVVLVTEEEDETWIDVVEGFAEAKGASEARIRKIVDRAIALHARKNRTDWRMLDWLAEAIAEPATRSAAFRDVRWGDWLFEGLEDPPSPAEAFEARHRDAIASAYLSDPGADSDLPHLFSVLCGRSVPALEAAFDQLGRALDAAGPFEYEDFVEDLVLDALEALSDDCGSETAERWEDVLLDADDDIPIETVRRDLAAKRERIVEEVLDAWERRVTGREVREAED